MGEIIQANIFFFITAMAVVVATVFLCVILFYIIRILRSVDRVAKRIDEKSAVLSEDLAHLRSYVAQGKLWRAFGAFVGRVARTHKRRRTENFPEDSLSE